MTGGLLSLFVGIDWGTQELEVCLVDPSGEVLSQRTFQPNGTGLAQLGDWLTETAGGETSKVQVAIELTEGPTVETLLERGFAVYGINPKQLDRFRDRFSPSGAKDDRRDARVLADSLRTDPRAFRALSMDAPEITELREWSRMHEELQQERVRATNRLRGQLQRYFPDALSITNDAGAEWFLRVIEEIPTPEEARRRRVSTVARILKTHRIRRITAEEVLDTLRQPPVHVSLGTVKAATSHIRLLTARIRFLNGQIAECSHHLERIFEEITASPAPEAEAGEGSEQRDIEILRSFPGVGRIVLATLLTEASQLLRARALAALRILAGVAPVTRRSGKQLRVQMRRACNSRLSGALYHWARVASQRDPHWRALYAGLRARGHSHGRACRGVADRLLAAACAALRTGTRYDATQLRQSERAA